MHTAHRARIKDAEPTWTLALTSQELHLIRDALLRDPKQTLPHDELLARLHKLSAFR